jgi:hypothetical protein
LTGACAVSALVLLLASVHPEGGGGALRVRGSSSHHPRSTRIGAGVPGAQTTRPSIPGDSSARATAGPRAVRVLVRLAQPRRPLPSPVTVALLRGLTVIDAACLHGCETLVLEGDATGSLSLAVRATSLPAWAVAVEAPWQRRRTWGDWTLFDTFQAAAGEERSVDLTLVEGSGFEAWILNENGAVLPGAQVVLQRTDGRGSTRRAESDGDGRARFENVEPGEHWLSAHGGTGARHRFRPLRVHLEAGAERRETLQAAGATSALTGRLVGLDRLPLAGALVKLRVEGLTISDTKTDSDGEYRLANLLAGEALVEVKPQSLPLGDDGRGVATTGPPLRLRVNLAYATEQDLGEHALATRVTGNGLRLPSSPTDADAGRSVGPRVRRHRLEVDPQRGAVAPIDSISRR